jgi:hypothetical protein
MDFLHILDLWTSYFLPSCWFWKTGQRRIRWHPQRSLQLSRSDDQRCILPWASLTQEFIFAEVARLGPMHWPSVRSFQGHVAHPPWIYTPEVQCWKTPLMQISLRASRFFGSFKEASPIDRHSMRRKILRPTRRSARKAPTRACAMRCRDWQLLILCHRYG